MYPLPNYQWNDFVLFSNLCALEKESGLYLNCPCKYEEYLKNIGK